MAKDLPSFVTRLAGGSELARYNLRVSQVRSRYRHALEKVYGDGATIHLAHTNNVFIKMKKGLITLIVYVDESIFAAELNAQRELIQLHLLEHFGEEIDQFEILTSRWSKYKNRHPYLEDGTVMVEGRSANAPLDENQKAFVAEVVSAVNDDKLRSSLQNAMASTLKSRAQD